MNSIGPQRNHPSALIFCKLHDTLVASFPLVADKKDFRATALFIYATNVIRGKERYLGSKMPALCPASE